MAPLEIPKVHVSGVIEEVTAAVIESYTTAVKNATNISLAQENITQTVSPSDIFTRSTSLPHRTFSPEIWAPPDDGDVYRLNTPLNAPEPSLDPVTGLLDGGGLLGSTGPDELGWIIPTAIVVIASMVGVAFAMYFGIRALELRMLSWCYRNCSCCCKPGGHGRRLLGGELYDNLSEDTDSTRRRESVRLRDFRERSPSYGIARSKSKEYTPPANPFDDDS